MKLFICGENWLKYLCWVSSLLFSPCSSSSQDTDFFFFFSPVPCHFVWHPPICYLPTPTTFSLCSPCLAMILTTRTLVNRNVANAEVLMSGSTSGAFNAKRNSLRASGSTFCLWASLHLADAITKSFMPHRDKTLHYGCEILGNIWSRERKLVCNRSTKIIIIINNKGFWKSWRSKGCDPSHSFAKVLKQ